MEENKSLRIEISTLRDDKSFLQTKVNKTYVQKELLSKDIASSMEGLHFMSSKFT